MEKSIIGIIKEVAQQETARIYTQELGIVTAIFPHSADDDKDNYQCSIKLKHKKQADGSDFELRKVPVMTAHMGMVNIPNVGDLVLVSFIGGNINAPIILGRLYNDEDIPPVNQENELLIQHSLQKGSSIKMDSEGVLTLLSQNEDKSILTINDEEVLIETSGAQVKISLSGGGIEIDAGSNPIDLKSTGNINIGDATTGQIKIGGISLANAVGDNDDIILSTHTHMGNLGAPCPILVPTEKINSIQAKARKTQVG
ncbi:MAG: phage baseplate assembly protein V [Bacteroidota bacterium]